MTTTKADPMVGRSQSPDLPTSSDLREMVSDVKSRTERAADDAAERVPELVDAVRANTTDVARAVQDASEPTLAILTAASIGLATGLLMAGAPRAVVLAAAAPAAFIAGALLMRGRTR
ncbi:MAG TPA: hypothetical protein VIF84_04010 [Candidatus Limnocylindrales bacterium]|jgi:hypothetical protein